MVLVGIPLPSANGKNFMSSRDEAWDQVSANMSGASDYDDSHANLFAQL
jgi:hypothetical protein